MSSVEICVLDFLKFIHECVLLSTHFLKKIVVYAYIVTSNIIEESIKILTKDGLND